MNPYATDKIVHHPEALQALCDRTPQHPILVQFKPMLACNQSCTFCAYGHRKPDDGPEQQGWKNMELMSDAAMPPVKMLELLSDLEAMGVKAIEITGGGEPLIYPHIEELFLGLSRMPIDVALVTNGTALTESRADIFAATRWKWARVSIDAGYRETYALVRRVPEAHWDKAWNAVRLLAERRTEPDQRVGVGFVVDTDDSYEVYNACACAKDAGADNVRISAAFTPQGLERFPAGALDEAQLQIEHAKRDLESDGFHIHDLLGERLSNLASPHQDYQFCGSKEVICVVGGDQNVYTCCTLAFNPKGLVGSIKDISFRQLWESQAKRHFFAGHDARVICDVECLYEKRNKRMIYYAEQAEADGSAEKPYGRSAEMDADTSTSIHRNFI